MHLIRAHKLFIAAAILLCVGFGVRDVATGDGRVWAVLRVAASAGAALCLALYLLWLIRTKGRGMEEAADRNGSGRNE